MLRNFKRSSVLVLIIFLLSISSAFSQKKYNSLYKPLPLIQRLSYQNFKNIKLLQVAIMNFGGGPADVERLVDQYAEASALFFQNKLEEAANKFQENEREILITAQKLVKKYKSQSDAMLINSIKLNIRISMKNALEGKKKNEVADKLLRNAQFGVQKGDDYHDRYINAKTAPPKELVKAIYYYRQAKENMILMHQVLDMDEDDKKKFMEQHKKDIEDNKNKIFTAREKIN